MERTQRQQRVLNLLEKNLTPTPTLKTSVDTAASELKKLGAVMNITTEELDKQLFMFAKALGKINGN